MAASDILERLLERRVIDIDDISEASYGTPWNCIVCGQVDNPGDSARCTGCNRVNFQLHLVIQQRLSECPPQVEERKKEVDFSQLELRNVDEIPDGPVWKCEICGTLDIPTDSIKCTGCGRLNFQLYAASLPASAPRKMPILEEVKLPPPIIEPSPVSEPISRILDFATLPLVPCTALKSQFWECQVCEEKNILSTRTHCTQCKRVSFPAYAITTDLMRERKSIARCFGEEEKSRKSDSENEIQKSLQQKIGTMQSFPVEPPLNQSPLPVVIDREDQKPSEQIQVSICEDMSKKNNSSKKHSADDHNGRLCCCCEIF